MAKLGRLKVKTFPVRIDFGGGEDDVKMQMRPFKSGYAEAQAFVEKLNEAQDDDDKAEAIRLIRARFVDVITEWNMTGVLHADACKALTEPDTVDEQSLSLIAGGSCPFCNKTDEPIPLTVDGLRLSDTPPRLLTTLLMQGFEAIDAKKAKSARY